MVSAVYVILGFCLSAKGAKNVFWPGLSPLQVGDSLTMAFNGKFLYITLNLIMLRRNPFDVRLDRKGW